MKKTNIAILGSTSHIAKGLINNFLQDAGFNLYLYTRSPEKIRSFIGSTGKSPDEGCVIHRGYRSFRRHSYAVIINCVGAGTMSKPGDNYSSYFLVAEKYDNLIIEYLLKNPGTLYISLSSGAVYGREFSAPVEENTANSIKVNHITTQDYYSITRLNAEAKHRAFKGLRIIDLRIFSYFSRFIDLTDGYFIAQAIDSISRKKVLVTDKLNFVRDYIHPQDLYSLIIKCISAGRINAAFDARSSKPVEKREILDYLAKEYGLRYKTIRFSKHVSPTGRKNIYCSNYNFASAIGYKPAYSSLDAIKEESRYIFNRDLSNSFKRV